MSAEPASAVDPDVELDEARREVLRRHARVIAGVTGSEGPLTAEHAFRPPADMTPAQGLGLLAAMLLVMLSGFASGALVAALGVRLASLVLLSVAAAASFGLRGISPGHHDFLSGAERGALLLVPALAVLSGSATMLALVPAFVHACVAGVMFASLDDEVPLVEKGARIAHPLAPAFIGPYCRKLTGVWAGLFGGSAAIIVFLALSARHAELTAWTAWVFWALVGLFSLVEFFFRKIWFRYYGQGPFDRLLSRLFPPESTARGRRSQAYVLRMRSELARLAEEERESRGQTPISREHGV